MQNLLAQTELPFNYLDFASYSLLFFSLIFFVGVLIGVLWLAWWMNQWRDYTLSPYGSLPMRRATNLSYASIGKIYLFLNSFHMYDNRMFNIHKAAVCPDTGRIFSDVIDPLNRIRVDWTFLQKRHPGNWISWGSLSRIQQEEISKAHFSLEGFQDVRSSPDPRPSHIKPEYALAVPGPLYVDLETRTLLGWKVIPGTDLEVLVVQHPKDWRAIPKKTKKKVTKTKKVKKVKKK